VDNIRTNLGEVGRGDVNWIGLAKDRNRSGWAERYSHDTAMPNVVFHGIFTEVL
jgi:hypothetical protein